MQNSNSIYVKVKMKASVREHRILVKDVAEIWCSRAEERPKIDQLTLRHIPEGEKRKHKYVISAIEILNRIAKELPWASITLLGEPDVVVDCRKKPEKHTGWEILKTAAVCLITFTGAAFAIMTFNNDVDVGTIFRTLYRLFTGMESNGKTVLEGTYSVGIFLGIVLFFNHFSHFQISDDPTPLEVQMRIYEKDVNTAIIENEERSEDGVDVE